MSPDLVRIIGAVCIVVPLVALHRGSSWVARKAAHIEAAPAPPAKTEDPQWLLLPLQCVAGVAMWCWWLIALGVFLAPLAALAWLVAR